MQYGSSSPIDYSFENVDDTEVMPTNDDVFVTEPEIPTLDPDPRPSRGPLKRPPPPAFMRRARSRY